MSYQERMKEENENARERYDLALERIELMLTEDIVQAPYLDYFRKVASFILEIKEIVKQVETNQLKQLSLEELGQQNHRCYEDIEGSSYDCSYANPSFSNQIFGEKYGKLLCFLYTEIRGIIAYSYEQRLFDITIVLELFIEIYIHFAEEEEETNQYIKSAIYYYVSDYSDITVEKRIGEMLDTGFSFATDIIMDADLLDLRYLFYFGEYISENEVRIAQFLNTLGEDQIQSMARTYTEGFRMGFLNNNIDITKKKVVNIRYSLGFERIVRAAINQFMEMGLRPTIYRAAVSSIHKKQHLKIGYNSTSPNKQYEYDHRFDDALYLDKAFVDRKLVNYRVAFQKNKEIANEYAGPAVMEIFGEKPFEPRNKIENSILSDKQQKLILRYNKEASLITNEYIKSDEYSFTIIAYPIPEIGTDFEAIFRETVKVNTLDMNQYKEIQQSMIDALDQGQFIRVKGACNNRTDMKIMLHKLKNPEKETIFENCLADVNIPVGEVFTSPVLEGTCGILHVKEVYLNELKYIDLELHFENGRITKYTCKNFSEEEENLRFVKENLMYQHDTLPLGEFAIGTNTTAYQMGKKYHISHKLPILIAEKTGPHFAVGDTCYKMSEENRVYNPDGKEIVAKDNECSILRKTDIQKAYFNCHTDITIPYDELGELSIYHLNGEKIDIIVNGKFVLKGTEELNIPLNNKN